MATSGPTPVSQHRFITHEQENKPTKEDGQDKLHKARASFIDSTNQANPLSESESALLLQTI